MDVNLLDLLDLHTFGSEGESLMAEGSPLYPLLDEINAAAAKGLPFLAVAMTVALPDICVSLASQDGRTNGEAYKAWCKANLPQEKFSFVTADDLWSMRCGVLHNGRFGDLRHNVSRVIFGDLYTCVTHTGDFSEYKQWR